MNLEAPRRRGLLAAAPLIALAVGGCTPGSSAAAGETELPTAFRDQLATRVVDAVEHDPTFRTEVTRDPRFRPVCVAAVFGVAPQRADTVDEVETIYTWVSCEWVSPADAATGPAEAAHRPGLSMPIALRFGPPVTYRAPSDGEWYADSVRRIFPRAVQSAAFSHPAPSARDALRDRIARTFPTPSPS